MINWQILLFIDILAMGSSAIFFKLASVKESPLYVTLLLTVFGGLLFLPTIDYFPPFSLIWIYPITAGIIYGVANILFFWSLSRGEVSLLSPLGNLTLVIVMILSIIFFQEPITVEKVVGTFLIIFGMGFLEKKENFFKSIKAVLKDKVCQIYLLSISLFSIAKIIDKFSLNHFTILSYNFLAWALPIFLIFPIVIFKGSVKESLGCAKRKFFYILIGTLLSGASYLSYLYMIPQLSLGIITSLGSSSVFITIASSYFFLHEKIENRWLAAILIVLGIGLIFYNPI